MRRFLAHLAVLGLLSVLVAGCATEEKTDTSDSTAKDALDITVGGRPLDAPVETAGVFADNRLLPDEVTPEIQADMDKAVPADGEEVVVFETSKGKIVVMLYSLVAPKTVDNFKKLVSDGFYDGTRFHRCFPGFMIQGGDGNSKYLDMSAGPWGTGNLGYEILDELNPIRHEPGVLSMAHHGPNTGGSQFFIMDGVASHLDYVHTAFGRVLSGQDVAQAIIVTGDAGNDGAVVPSEAVVLSRAYLATWPIDDSD